MNIQNDTVAKNLGDPSITVGDTVSLIAVMQDRQKMFEKVCPLIFQLGVSETNRVGDRLPLCYRVAVPEGLTLSLGDEYRAVVTDIEHTLDIEHIAGVDRGVVIITVENLERYEAWGDIVLRGECLTRRFQCGNNIIREEVIPVTVKDQTYLCDYVPDRTILIREVWIKEGLFLQSLSPNKAVQGTMSDTLKKFLPKLNYQEYQALGTFSHDWETIKLYYGFTVPVGDVLSPLRTEVG